MKGVVFTEFLEMVEQKFGMEMVNALIENNDLSSDGVYRLWAPTIIPKWCPWSWTSESAAASRFLIC